jgi:tetratricopeptide (TPR) repeat protein
MPRPSQDRAWIMSDKISDYSSTIESPPETGAYMAGAAAQRFESAVKSTSYKVVDRRRKTDRRQHSRRIIDRELSKAAKPQKDNWDKIGAIAPIISGSLIFVMGGWFTYFYNQQQLRLQEVQTIEKFIPHLMGNEQSKKAAILAISAMTNPELAGKFASIFASSGTVSAMQKIATTANTEQDKSTATKALSDALDTLAVRESKLSDIESSYRRDISSQSSVTDDNSADMAYKMSKLAQLYTLKGQYALAEPLFKRSLDLRKAMYGNQNPIVAETLKGMAEMYQSWGQPQQAEDCLKQARQLEAQEQASASAPVMRSTTTTKPAQASSAEALRSDAAPGAAQHPVEVKNRPNQPSETVHASGSSEPSGENAETKETPEN